MSAIRRPDFIDAIDLLEQIEWAPGIDFDAVCPFCLGAEHDGHAEDCGLDWFLRNVERPEREEC